MKTEKWSCLFFCLTFSCLTFSCPLGLSGRYQDQCTSGRLPREPSETVMQTELQHAASEEGAGDPAEVVRSDGLITESPCRMVEDVRSVHAETPLLSLSDLGRLAQREVHVEHPRGAEHPPLQLSQRSRARLEEYLPV